MMRTPSHLTEKNYPRYTVQQNNWLLICEEKSTNLYMLYMLSNFGCVEINLDVNQW